MGRSDYISDSLVNIRDRLKNYSDGARSLPGNDASDPGAQAVRGRAAEALNLRRDLGNRFTNELRDVDAQLEELTRYGEFLRTKIAELDALADGPSAEDVATVGEYFRRVEHIRLEFLRDQAKQSQYGTSAPAKTAADGGTPAAFGMAELLSMTRRQWWRIGLGLFAPVIAAIGIGALVIALAVLIGMGVFG